MFIQIPYLPNSELCHLSRNVISGRRETWNRMPGLQICQKAPSFWILPKNVSISLYRAMRFLCPVSKWLSMIQEKKKKKRNDRKRERESKKGRLVGKIIVIRSGRSKWPPRLLRGRCLFPPLPFQAMKSQVWPRVILRKRGSEDRCNGGSRANAWIHGVFRPD